MKILRNIGIWVLFTGVLFLNQGCLKFQKNADYTPSVLDNHINMTAWQYIKNRSYNYAGKDTIFKLLRQAIEYSGIDTNELGHSYYHCKKIMDDVQLLMAKGWAPVERKLRDRKKGGLAYWAFP